MALTCTETGLISVVPGSLRQLGLTKLRALYLMYLYHTKNPTQVATANVTNLLLTSNCFTCLTDTDLLALLVWTQRQAAIDAGASEPAFNVGSELRKCTQMLTQSWHEMNAIEVQLRCQLS